MSHKASPRRSQNKARESSQKEGEVSLKSEKIEAATRPENCHQPHPAIGDETDKQISPLTSSAGVAASSSLPKFSKNIAHKICEELAKGRTLKAVCASSKHYPLPHIVRKWAMEDIDGFASDFAKARELGFLTMADELIEIVDQIDGNITRDKLRVDTRKWLLSKALPKGFGDTADVKATVNMSLDENAYEMGKKIAFALELSSRAAPFDTDDNNGDDEVS